MLKFEGDMAEYQLTPVGVLRLVDDLNIPEDPGNRDFVEYRLWLDEGGKPLPMTVTEDAVSAERAWRDAAIERVKWLTERHRDQHALGITRVLADEQFNELLAFIQLLRDWPQSSDFPDRSKRPIPPDWLASQSR